MASKKPVSQRSQATSPWEWAVAAIGGLIIVCAIGYMVWYGIARPETIPKLELVPLETTSTAGVHVVRFSVRNSGSSTAASVQVEGRLKTPDGVAEVSEVTVDYVPPDSEREAYLQFTRNPDDFELSLRVKGMSKP